VAKTERLQKIMARAGYGSRRSCETLISAGRVRVNGRTAKLGLKADPDSDLIEVDGQAISFEELLYIMLNKPKGVLSSTEDELQQGRRTVRDLVDLPGHLYPVGRLDKQSEGLIFLTNDGQLAFRLTHPSFGHDKVYHVEVEGRISDSALERWRKGVLLDGRRTAPAKIEVIYRRNQKSSLRVTLREGRKRQIRRISASFGHPVTRLIRLQLDTIKLGDLEAGQWRYLTEDELLALRESVAATSNGKHGGDLDN
jgi:pseudouridine synthase